MTAPHVIRRRFPNKNQPKFVSNPAFPFIFLSKRGLANGERDNTIRRAAPVAQLDRASVYGTEG